MSMRETMVPKPFEAQRTKARMLPGHLVGAIENVLLRGGSEADSVLDAVLQPQELDIGETTHGALLRAINFRNSPLL
jgi:hypothetical protein